jgi:hypothetical protein
MRLLIGLAMILVFPLATADDQCRNMNAHGFAADFQEFCEFDGTVYDFCFINKMRGTINGTMFEYFQNDWVVLLEDLGLPTPPMPSSHGTTGNLRCCIRSREWSGVKPNTFLTCELSTRAVWLFPPWSQVAAESMKTPMGGLPGRSGTVLWRPFRLTAGSADRIFQMTRSYTNWV